MELTSGVERRVLPNGLTLLAERNDSAPVVAAVSHVKAGYYDEPDQWVGISHVLEHMYFKGTQRRGVGELAREIQSLGGYLNAGTIYEKTVYYSVLPAAPGTLERALDLQADALTDAALGADELARELEVIIQEANRKLDSPGDVAGETLYELLFAQHRMRRWRIGREDTLRRLTAADLRQYYRTRYTPERTIIALVGDLDVGEALELAAATYDEWRTDPPHDDGSPPETAPPPPTSRVLRGDVKRPVAAVGWRTVDVLHEEEPGLDFAASILGSGRGSWLSRAVRSAGLASQTRAVHYANSELGVFQLMLYGDEDRIDDAVEQSLYLVDQLGRVGPDRQDVDRVRSLLSMQWSRRLESMDGRATLWADCEALGGFALANRFHRQISQVTEDDVRSTVDKYLGSVGPSVVLYGPEGFQTRFDGQTSSDHRISREPLPPVSTTLPVTSPLAARARPNAERIGEVHHLTLPGADLLVRPKRGADLVFVGAYVHGIRSAETTQTAGISALLARAAVRGAGGMDSEQLALAAEMLGGTVSPAVSLDLVGWGITVRAGAVAQAAELLHTVAAEPNLTPEQVSIERSLLASDAARQRDDMFGYPIRRVIAECLPTTSYGLPILGDPETVSALDDQLLAEWADRLRTRRLTVVAVGDLAAEEMFEALRAFERWSGTARGVPDEIPAPTWEAGRGAEPRDKAQSAIAMAFRAEPYGSPDRIPLIVSGSLMSGLAGTLFEELREKRSLAYTVSAMPWLKRDAGAVLTYIATAPDREEEARRAMLEQLAATARIPPTESQVERARNYAAGALQLRLQSAHAVAGEILEAWMHGDLASLPTLADDLRSVSIEDVRRVAERVFDEKERAEFVVRGRSGSETGGMPG